MKAIIQKGYGSVDVYSLGEVDPPPVADGDVLVRVHAASVHADVWHVMTGRPFVLRLMGAGFRTPKNPIPGTDMAGTVERVGQAVTRFSPGDAVFGECVRGHQWQNGGAYAEFVAVPEKALATKPENVSFEAAASVATSGCIAIQGIRDEGGVEAGDRVLVNGAGGNVGSFAVQIAKSLGAHVTGVDHTTKLDMLRTLGADQVVDYTKTDVTQSGDRYDCILDVASTFSLRDARRILNPGGVYVLIGHDHFGAKGRRWLGSVPRAIGLMLMSRFMKGLPRGRISTDNGERIQVLRDLLERGALRPIIDRTYPLEGLTEAMAYLQSGQSRGKIVLSI